jgi:hypothetical protein
MAPHAKLDCFVAHAPLRKRFAFAAGNDGRLWVVSTTAKKNPPEKISGGCALRQGFVTRLSMKCRQRGHHPTFPHFPTAKGSR